MDTAPAQLDDQLRRLEERLCEQEPAPSELVRECVQSARSRFAGARIRAFVPILVERAVRSQLRTVAGEPATIGFDLGSGPAHDRVRPYRGAMWLRTWAWWTAKHLLSDELPRRWAHTRGVAHQAKEISWALAPEDRETLIAAAWLHDIGYAEIVIDTGFHQLDGARYLERHETPRRVCALVAHHAGAAAVAEQIGLSCALSAYPDELGPVRDALWYCDMTTSPDGVPVSYEDRMVELRARRGPEDPAVRALAVNGDERAAAVRRTEQLLGHVERTTDRV
jgi:putative nucleotidyltransferase with HDIG domain